ncbi:MAG: hypothetical protein LC623_03330, partial [Halobacteriales archaeon]|nr:hypothetical protein [Halobacteriales archaeon]
FSAGLTAPVPTNATYVYAWNNTFASVNVTADAQVDGGNATVTVVDDHNRTVASISVTATTRASVLVPAASKGPWTVTLNYTAFKGRLNVTILPPPAPTVTVTPTVTGSATASFSSTTPTASTTSTTKTPALGLLALVGLLAAAAVTVRRRL